VNEIELPYRGWYKGTAPVVHAPGNDSTVMELRCPLGVLKVYGLIDTPDRQERGEEVACGYLSRPRIRGIVPRQYTHVQVVPMSGSPGFAWWRLGYRPGSSLPEWQVTMPGGHTDVFRYSGPPAVAHLEVRRQYAQVKHYPANGAEWTSLAFANAPYRGKIEIPGPGLIVVSGVTSTWTLALVD